MVGASHRTPRVGAVVGTRLSRQQQRPEACLLLDGLS
jgi:hypothetical protein